MNEPATREDLQQTADAIREDFRQELRHTADDIRADFRQELQRTGENILRLIA